MWQENPLWGDIRKNMRTYYQKYEQQITKIKKPEIRDIKNVGKEIC